MTPLFRIAAALLALCCLASMARADSTLVTATSGWVKAASAGTTVRLQSPTGVIITTSAGAPASQAGIELLPGNRVEPFTPSADLYVRSGTVVVTTAMGAAQAGSGGTDFSAGTVALPVVGANFPASGPYANYVLIKTIPAAARSGVEIDNASGAPIVVLRDDGTAVAGFAAVNASLIPLAGGSASGQQGGSWSSTTFKGRLQVYAPSAAALVPAYVD